MNIQYEEKFGVKVDVRIPDTVRAKLYEQWEGWKRGDVESYLSLDKPNLRTRYEHFTIGSGVGLPPDPFKPLALQHDDANLEAVVEARIHAYPPGKEYGCSPSLLKDFEKITGLKKFGHYLIAQYPEIDVRGRIKIPRIVGVYAHENKIDFDDDVIAKLQLPTLRDDLKLWEGVIAREVFDFNNGYRIEFVGMSEEE